MSTLSGQMIADFLGYPLQGESLPVEKPCDLVESGPGDLVWIRSLSEEKIAVVEQRRPSLAICNEATAQRLSVPCLASEHPRLDFIKVVTRFFVKPEKHSIHPSAIIESGARIGTNVGIGAYTRIGPQVVVGDDCYIGSGVAIEGDVTIGRGCHIKPNSVIGAPGFGFEYDETGNPIHFPHLGRVVLEDSVWVGACATIERATLATTRVGRGCKIDDLVQIGHNSTVGPGTFVMANAVIGGGTVVGERCWIAPNSVIKERVTVGDRAVVGLGAVVIRDVPNDTTVAGVPAKPLARKRPT